MAYKIILSPLAQKNIEDSIEFYSERSIDAPKNFLLELEEIYRSLKVSPFYKILYKNFRAVPLKRFPFILVFIINDKNEVVIKACFHTSKSTKKYPK